MKDAGDSILKLIQNMDDDFRLRMAVYVSFAAACMVILLLIWLLLRSLRLWYWKVDMRMDMLAGIEREIKDLKAELNRPAAGVPAPLAGVVAPITADERREQECEASEAATGESKEKLPPAGKKYRTRDCNISKSGRIYTKDELEAQIMD